MDDSPLTRASLLAPIRDPRDGEAWRQFVQVYAALVYTPTRRSLGEGIPRRSLGTRKHVSSIPHGPTCKQINSL